MTRIKYEVEQRDTGTVTDRIRTEPERIEYTDHWLFVYPGSDHTVNPKYAIPRERVIVVS